MEEGFRLNREYILLLITNRGWSKSKFAILLKMSSSPVYMWFNGHRPGSLILMREIVRLFPDEPLDKLFLRD